MRKSTVSGLVTAVAATLVLTAASAGAHCKGKHDPDRNGGDCPPHDDDGVGTELVAIGAVGHSLDTLSEPLLCDNDSGARGDFWDRGTAAGCELLDCTASSGAVTCGTKSQPKPKFQISGLFHMWGDDPDSSGDPNVCHLNGNVDASMQVTNNGSDFEVLLFWSGLADAGLPGCGGTGATEIRYGAKIENCFLAEGVFPPTFNAVPDTKVVCPAGAFAAVRSEGGGRAAKKCGCTATGTLMLDSDMNFRVVEPDA